MFFTLFVTTIIMDAKEEVRGHSIKSVKVHTGRTSALVDGSDTPRLSPKRQLFMCDVKPKVSADVIDLRFVPKLGDAQTAKCVFPKTVDLLLNLTTWFCCLKG